MASSALGSLGTKRRLTHSQLDRPSYLVPDPSEINPANPYSRSNSPDIRYVQPASSTSTVTGLPAALAGSNLANSVITSDDEIPLPLPGVKIRVNGEVPYRSGRPVLALAMDQMLEKGKGHATFDQADWSWSDAPYTYYIRLSDAIKQLPRYWRRKARQLSPVPVYRRSRRRHSMILTGGLEDDRYPPGKRKSFNQSSFPFKRVLLLCLLLGGFWIWKTQSGVRMFVYPEPPIIEGEDFPQHWEHPPLFGCFDADRVARTEYNLTRWAEGRARHTLNAGSNLKFEMECYDYAGTIRPDLAYDQTIDEDAATPLIYHTYWRMDLLPFDRRQVATIDSFLATQRTPRSRLYLWTNDARNLSTNPFVEGYIREWPEIFHVRQVDVSGMTAGTALHKTEALEQMYDGSAWVDGDAVRLLALWNHGGIWFDMDEILTRDLNVLAEHEFVTQWDCRDDPNLILNGHIMHFRKHSPYICEAFNIMATEPVPRPNSLDWGAFLYQKLYRRLMQAGIKPFSVLPWCFTDPQNCHQGNRFPDPFEPDPATWKGLQWLAEEGQGGDNVQTGQKHLEKRIDQIWSIHLHNQWGKDFPAGGYINRLLQKFSRDIALRKRQRSEAGA